MPVFAILLLLVASLILWHIYSRDPYFAWTQIKLPFLTEIDKNGQIKLLHHAPLKLVTTPFSRAYALFKTGVRIPLYSLLTKERRITGTETTIIEKIHKIRFNPNRPYVITGGHYSDLYMRNLGVFFNGLLDPRLKTSEEDWQNRQRIALQTVAYDLEFLKQNTQAVTTVIPLGDNRFTGLNIYKHPSDALFAVVYTLKALIDDKFLVKLFPPIKKQARFSLKSQAAAKKLLKEYQSAITKSLNHYLERTIDPATGLVFRNLHLSSARDGIKRDCSFYDNVIAWATVKLADELGIPHRSTMDLGSWKKKIINQYWDEFVGIFRDDLHDWNSDEKGVQLAPPTFSADSLIVISTGFLDVRKASERVYLERIVSYIQKNKLDWPFPLRYTAANDRTQMHGPVKYFAPSYMGEGIWSHWGMEYIKTLTMLSKDHPEMLKTAQKHLKTYKMNIEHFGGYPELYSSTGKFFKSVFMQGVLKTGWVVNYEQAKMMAGVA